MEEILNRKNLYLNLLELIENKESCGIATVTYTQGSTPQKPGSSALFNNSGLFAGTVGGGYVEHDVVKQARESINTKKSTYHRFDLDDEIEKEGSVICGGRMRVLIDANPEKHQQTFTLLKESHENRIPGVLISTVNSLSEKELDINRFWITTENRDNILKELPKIAWEKIQLMLEQPRFGDFEEIVIHTSPEVEDIHILLEAIVPLPQLFIAGAGHVGQAITHLGNLLDFHVTTWDDREEYANETNLPDAHRVLSGELNKSLEQIVIDRNTFIVIVTRGHQYDSEVLRKVIASNAGYIGMIGSKKKVAQVRQQFINNKWATPEQWNKIYTPIGLDIHSKTVQEIAISIVAELIKVRYELNQVYE
ncbi:MAG: XdhC family protein [Bacteroidales bacterium]